MPTFEQSSPTGLWDHFNKRFNTLYFKRGDRYYRFSHLHLMCKKTITSSRMRDPAFDSLMTTQAMQQGLRYQSCSVGKEFPKLYQLSPGYIKRFGFEHARVWLSKRDGRGSNPVEIHFFFILIHSYRQGESHITSSGVD